MLSRIINVYEKILFTLIFALILSGCSEKYHNTVICDISSAGNYNKIIAELLPAYKIVNENKRDISGLKAGNVVESYDVLAEPATGENIAKYWYPHYIATAVIAIDRSKCAADISGWKDLIDANEAVGISEDITELRLLMASVAYGLEGENFSFKQAAELLSALYESKRLITSYETAPIRICFDMQAVSKIIAGEDIEIIIPKEGTLSFKKGLLSNFELSFNADVNELAENYALRTLNGNGRYYPDINEYNSAHFVEDYEHFNDICENAVYVFKRDVEKIGNYLYSSADGRTHMLYALGFIMIVIAWLGYAIRRTMQKGIQRAVIIMAALVIGWVFLRMFKYQIPTGVLSQYCWYGYYFFQLGLSLAVLWMAWVVDRLNYTDKASAWFHICGWINLILFLLIFTNNWHYMAFDFNPNDPYYTLNYSYGPVYYLVISTIFIQALIAQIFFIRKSWKSPRKASFIFPSLFYIMLCGYCIGYIYRVPFIWETDLTIVTGTFVIIFIEACIRAGLIPVNTKYKVLFENSPLKMQIYNNSGEIMLKSALKGEALEGTRGKAFSADDFIIHTNAITGGGVAWQEDIGGIKKLHKEIAKSVARLETANGILMEEERIKRRLESAEAKTTVFASLEAEINKRTEQLLYMIEGLPEDEPCQSRIAQIASMFCYVKRRCNLFFRERETDDISLNELMIYFNELTELVSFSGIKIHIFCDRSLRLLTKQATCFYSFFYGIINHVLSLQTDTMLVQIIKEDEKISLKVLQAEYENAFRPEAALLSDINALNGECYIRELDDGLSMVLTFSMGEE